MEHLNIMTLLLDHNTNIEATNKYKQTALVTTVEATMST